MFTGIIEELGTVRDRDGGRFTFAAALVLEDLKIGDSVAVNGCCLTVIEIGEGWWRADVVPESLARTNLADAHAGDPVNLERPVRLADRLGGHLVQGHVDGVGERSSAPPPICASRHQPSCCATSSPRARSPSTAAASRWSTSETTGSPSPSSPTPPR